MPALLTVAAPVTTFGQSSGFVGFHARDRSWQDLIQTSPLTSPASLCVYLRFGMSEGF